MRLCVFVFVCVLMCWCVGVIDVFFLMLLIFLLCMF